ncbi:MAG: type II secretion system protein [Planctomycetes bacterium]|nr:type II secretion system protein [Planctomycetota bacterium]
MNSHFRQAEGGCVRSGTLRGFTLIELLVVIAVIAVLIGIMLPALGQARKSARSLVCLSNIRQIEVAHALYADTYKGAFVDAGLTHGGPPNTASINASWINTLKPFYGGTVNVRSPLDKSEFWATSQGGQDPGYTLDEFTALAAAGKAVPLTKLARWTSYGLNDWLTTRTAPGLEPREPFNNLSKIEAPSATVHFLQMTQTQTATAKYAKSDHVHSAEWGDGPPNSAPAIASTQLDLAVHGGKASTWNGLSNYGYLDGHAATQRFREVYTDYEKNRFLPRVAR